VHGVTDASLLLSRIGERPCNLLLVHVWCESELLLASETIAECIAIPRLSVSLAPVDRMITYSPPNLR
jgi:hypothetical protein